MHASPHRSRSGSPPRPSRPAAPRRPAHALRPGLCAGLLFLVVAAVVAAPGCGAERPPPNVVFIVLDTLRRDHMSVYGYPWPTTPRLDALAAGGATFLDCNAQSSWTMPSMISLMTGLPIFTTIYRIPEHETLLAEHFAEAGYRTGAFVANSLVSSEAGFARGVETFAIRQKLTKQWDADEVVDRALGFLDEDDGDTRRPFLAWLHFLDTHDPYVPPTVPWRRTPAEVFDAAELEVIASALAAAPEAERPGLAYDVEPMAGEIDRYDGELHFLDAQIGRLLDELARRGLDENTYVVVVADHGETLFRRPEHPDRVAELRKHRHDAKERMRLTDYVKRDHDRYVYDELVRTPFLVAGPGIVPGRRIEALVSNLDVLPTVLGLCGLPVPRGLSGRDLSAPLRGRGDVQPAEWVPLFCDSEIGARLPDGRKIVLPPKSMQKRHGFVPRVYDLRADPRELQPRVPDADMERALARLAHEAENDAFRDFGAQDADEETLAKLRELGYVR